MNDQRNLIIAIVFSVTILLGFQFLYEKPKQEREQARQAEIAAQTTPTTTPPATATPPAAPGREPRPGDASVQVPTPLPSSAPRPDSPKTAPRPAVPPAAAMFKTGPRLEIRGIRLKGSIALKGGRLDDLILTDYFETIDPSSAPITLFAPVGSKASYFAEFGWVAENSAVKLPGATTLWRADRPVLTTGKPVTLTWDNGQGLKFLRTYSLDENYMFSITQRVQNRGNTAVTLFPYSLVSRTGTPETLGFYILHEGPIGVLQGTLEEVDYDDLREAKTIKNTTTGGWIGITDKYWLAALAPDQKEKVTTRFVHSLQDKTDKYQVDTLGQGRNLAPGGNITVESHLFAGAKEVKLLDTYAKNLDIHRFDLAIDFGWFYFLTKPFFYALDFFNSHLGNFGLSILLLTVLIKILFFPLANKSYRSMSAMKKLQPKMTKLREQYKDDRAKLNQETMALYKREKVNPAAGCMPIVIQIPVFFSLYKVLFVSIEMRHTPFYGWIRDLSAPDPTSIFNLFGLIPFTPPDFLMIGAWPLIMGISMFLQMKLNPAPADPIQAKIFMFMPIFFTILLAPFPAGLVIYWAWNNTLSIAQQFFIMRRAGAV